MAGAVPWPSSLAGVCGVGAALSAAACSAAAACPSGDRAMHSAASSAVTKLPRYTSLPPRHTCAT